MRDAVGIIDFGSQHTQLIAHRMRQAHVHCRLLPWDAPPGSEVLTHSENSPVAAMGDRERGYYGLRFHPKVAHADRGEEILRLFAVDVCGCTADCTPASFVEQAVSDVRARVGSARVICGPSGGDSAVAAALIHRAIGDQLACIFLNTGLLRRGEPEQMARRLNDGLGTRLVAVDATQDFITALDGVTDPEEKRRVVGQLFIRLFEREAGKLGEPHFPGQGTLYPDAIESRGPERQTAACISNRIVNKVEGVNRIVYDISSKPPATVEWEQ